MIGVFNKNISYQNGCVIYTIYSGEHRDYEFLKENIPNHILKRYQEDGTFELFQPNELKQEVPLVKIEVDFNATPTQPDNQDQTIQNQDDPQTVFEIMYKTTQPIQDKDGNEIEVGSQFTESELKEIIAQDKRQSKKKIKDLLEEQKLMEVKKL